jgi:uncharacterized protein (TIGR02145 family)
MPRPFARNTGAPIAGTTQIGNIAAGTPTAGFTATGLPWWNGPDESLGYIIATQVVANNQPTPVSPSVTASVGFWRSTALTDASFISLAQHVTQTIGNPQTFTTASAAKTWLNTNGFWTSWVDPIPTSPIGTQLWTTKNLDVTTYRNGDTIPEITDPIAWTNAGLSSIGAWCYYNNDPANNNIYGKLYNWHAVNDSRGLAPAGYHISTNGELITLGTFLGGDSVAGGKMKSIGTSLWNAPNTSATNESGFSGLPGGYKDVTFTPVNSFFINLGNFGSFWTSTDGTGGGGNNAFYYNLALNSAAITRNDSVPKQWGLSVRLIKD